SALCFRRDTSRLVIVVRAGATDRAASTMCRATLLRLRWSVRGRVVPPGCRPTQRCPWWVDGRKGLMRLSRVFAAAVAGTALLVAAGCTSKTDTANKNNPAPIEKVTYATGFGQFGREAYVYVGIDKGYFRDAGIEVTVKPGAGTGDTLKQLTAGNIDIAPVDFTGAMIQIGGGQVQGVT